MLVEVLSTTIAVTAMIGTIYFSSQARRTALKSLAIQQFNAQQSYRLRVTDWANEVVAVMSECVITCELDPRRTSDCFDRRNRLRAQLSGLIDQGRWFFENDKDSGYGQWKEAAYRGIAPQTVSCIKEVLFLVEKLNYMEIASNSNQRQPIVVQKRQFVSEIQEFVGPAQVHEELNRLSDGD